MQTFLPFPDFEQSVRVLDDRRLGKQRVETLQVMGVLVAAFWDNAASQVQDREPRGWRTHPVVLMWRGHEGSLLDYQAATCRVWVERGFNDTCYAKTAALVVHRFGDGPPTGHPAWLGDVALHRSHQSNLIRKDAELYGPLFPGVPADLEYVWPVGPRGTDGA
jgi:hypothetical protein